MVELLSQTTPKAAKSHRCWDCGRWIAKGERHIVNAMVNDGQAYRLRSHMDCHAAALEYIAEGYPPDYDDGIPPLHEMIWNGDGQRDLDAMRGHWPHVVCRLELTQQLRDAR